MDFENTVLEIAQNYIQTIPDLTGQTISLLLAKFVVEKYKEHRNFPSHFTEERILADMNAHTSTIAMAIVDVYMKLGAEGELSHTENGITRQYENAYISSNVFSNINPYVNTI